MGIIVGDQDSPQHPPIERYRSYLILLAQAQVGHRVAAKVDASDMVQQAMLKAYEARGEFEGRGPAELAAWLRRILARTIANAVRDLRRAKRDLALERSLEAGLEDSSGQMSAWIADGRAGPASRAEGAEQLVLVADAVAALPEAQRTAILLKHCRAMPLAEVAREMNRSPASVASLLRRGLQELRVKLGGSGDSPDAIAE
jgi:RNA polymerase sigma-70 factor (ECF subfamily)